jgi:2Fe-2S ferredoxin
MVEIIFRDSKGQTWPVEARGGSSLMEVAVRAGIEGIDAICGGACSCATCHVYVDPAWIACLPVPMSLEQDMLEMAEDKRPTSRLSCQIKVTEALHGLQVEIPARQTNGV